MPVSTRRVRWVVPRLPRGVYVHVHDIPPDFEYPRAWVDAGRAWHESYLLRAFFMFNPAFQTKCTRPIWPNAIRCDA